MHLGLNHWLAALARMDAYQARTKKYKRKHPVSLPHVRLVDAGEAGEGIADAHICECTGRMSYLIDRRR